MSQRARFVAVLADWFRSHRVYAERSDAECYRLACRLREDAAYLIGFGA